MNSTHTSWSRLTTGARLAPADSRDTAAPHGFSTRIVALAFAGAEPSFAALFARFSGRALAVSALLMIVGVAANVSPVLHALEGESVTLNNDPVAEWLGTS